MRVLVILLLFCQVIAGKAVTSFYTSKAFVHTSEVPFLENWTLSVKTANSVLINLPNSSNLQGALIERSDNNISFKIIDTVQSQISQYIDSKLKTGFIYFYRISYLGYTSFSKYIAADEQGVWRNLGEVPGFVEVNDAVVTDRNKIYGGFGSFNEAWVCTPGEKIWEAAVNPGQILNPSVCQTNDFAYLAFGKFNKYLQEFDFSDGSWQKIDSFPEYKYGVNSFVIKDNIYFAGGLDLTTDGTANWIERFSKELWRYDLKLKKWKQLPDLPFESAVNSPVFIKDQIAYIIVKQKYIWKYIPDDNKKAWSLYDTLNFDISGNRTAYISGKFYFLTDRKSFSGMELWEYKVDSKKLTLISVFPGINVKNVVIASSNTDLYIINSKTSQTSAEYWVFDTDMPFAPDELKAYEVSHNQIRLSWNDNSIKETGYVIKRSDSYLFTSIDTVPANVHEYLDLNVKENTKYIYQVCAINSSVISDPSNTAEALTLISVPKTPGSLKVSSRNEFSVNLSWTDSAFNELKYYIERSEDNVHFSAIDSLMPNATVYYDSKDLQEGKHYYYHVYCSNDRGRSNVASGSVTTLLSYPFPPNAFSGIPYSESEVNLSWRDSAYNESGYIIERSTRNGYQYQVIDSVEANKTHFQDKGLLENTTYYYRVCAKNSRGKSDYTSEIKIKTLESYPIAPDNLTAAFKPTGIINLSWSDNSSNETCFYIERAEDPNGFILLDSVKSGIDDYTDSKVDKNKKYFYRITAANSRGKSASSGISSVTSLEPPFGLVAEAVTSAKVTLKWNRNPVFETGYVIVRRDYFNDVYFVETPLDTVSIQISEYIDTTEVQPRSRYGYLMYSINQTGESALSSESVVVTPSANGISVVHNLLQGLYPNPCDQMLYIELGSDYPKSLIIHIINSSGKVEISETFHLSKNMIEMDVSHLEPGLYILQVSASSKVLSSGKFFKRKSM